MIYRPLFKIDLHHAYFLNRGEEVFENLSDHEKNELLSEYRVSDYLSLVPTLATQKNLKGYRLLFKPHSAGFYIVSPTLGATGSSPVNYHPLIALPDNLTLTFGLYATDAYFGNYTEINAKNNTRFYLFSNVKPATETSSFANLFTADGTIDSTFLLSEAGSRKILHTIALEDGGVQTGSDRFSIANIDEADIDTPEALEVIDQSINTQKNNGLLGFVRLTVRGDSDHHLLEFDDSDPADVEQFIRNPYPEFMLNFRNRETLWRYTVSPGNDQLVTESVKPLVKHGFVQIMPSDFNPEPTEEYHYPNPTASFIREEESNYYSDIFI